jgi:hypothetical protein
MRPWPRAAYEQGDNRQRRPRRERQPPFVQQNLHDAARSELQAPLAQPLRRALHRIGSAEAGRHRGSDQHGRGSETAADEQLQALHTGARADRRRHQHEAGRQQRADRVQRGCEAARGADEQRRAEAWRAAPAGERPPRQPEAAEVHAVQLGSGAVVGDHRRTGDGDERRSDRARRCRESGKKPVQGAMGCEGPERDAECRQDLQRRERADAERLQEPEQPGGERHEQHVPAILRQVAALQMLHEVVGVDAVQPRLPPEDQHERNHDRHHHRRGDSLPRRRNGASGGAVTFSIHTDTLPSGLSIPRSSTGIPPGKCGIAQHGHRSNREPDAAHGVPAIGCRRRT